MAKNILIILGHPARERQSFCEVLALAYQKGARKKLDMKCRCLMWHNCASIRSCMKVIRATSCLEPDIADAQHKIRWAEHLVIVYPLWVHMISALLKGFFERTFTQNFAYALNSDNPFDRGLLKGSIRPVLFKPWVCLRSCIGSFLWSMGLKR